MKNAAWWMCLLGLAACSADTSVGAIADLDPDMVEDDVEAGGTVSTDPEGTGATREDPIETSITVPAGGAVTIEETDITQEAPEGIQFFGQQINIEAPPGTVEEPLIIRFELHDSLVPSDQSAQTLQIFREGVLAADCTGEVGHASPDPCVTQRMEGAGSIEFTVLTSRASAWNWGFLLPGSADDPKGVIDLDQLQQDPWTVTINGDVATVMVPFSTPLPSKISALANPGAVITQALTLVVRSDVTQTTADITAGKLVGEMPDAPGEYTFSVNPARTEGTIALFNETPAGTTLKTDRTYTVSISVDENDYVETMDSATFVVQPE